jgi:two-component system sensor histidine kinase RegB
VGLTTLLFLISLCPICISAATLSWSYTWVITSLCVASYTLLLFFHIALPVLSPAHHHGNHQDINLHILGMWLNFFISAALITYFVVKMAQDLRRQDDLLNQKREDDLRDEQLMAVATLAAGTAHELGTPLSTMKV